ncbi:hypothetical protein EDD29_2406 [Actinocorallia herbida]|uniref:DUF5753 domain-containing protein n=1 Tax=Actinocorallia herbida TaxID=58109 RepID=A0A3N1CUA2_9ACTN|nr:Scr1 family TA system antitoxin-like transcriptional regulator [Actinocorallia herbida]ROO84877.1 hypothetical protein EDD29_2406 [Actinocorallia herbida]
MSELAYPDPAASLWFLIARELHEFRIVLGLTGSELGMILGVDKAAVSKIEHGKLRLRPDQARLLDAWERAVLTMKLAEGGRARLVSRASALSAGRWELMVFHAGRENSDDWQEAYEKHKERASVMRAWEPVWVPGLMQTPDYARKVIYAGFPENPEKLLRERMQRQERFLNGSQHLWALIDEDVLSKFTGHPEVMRAQLAHLLELSALDKIGLRVIPRGRIHAGFDGAFEVMHFGDGTPPMAYTEAALGWRLVRDVPEVDSFALRYDRLGQLALPEVATRDLITKHLETM